MGYSPIIVVDAAQILADFPQGHVLHVVRNPWSAYADTKKRPLPLSLPTYLLGWTLNQYHALLYKEKFPERMHIVRAEDVMADPLKTLGAVCEKLGLESAATLKTPTWNGAPLAEIYPWGTIRQATSQANRNTAEELSNLERDEIRARAWQYLEVFDYKSFISSLPSARDEFSQAGRTVPSPVLHGTNDNVSYQLISIVLPVYNQADHISEVVREYEEALTRVPTPHELILVVNASRDASLEVCSDLANHYSAVRVVHEKKGGWGLAVRRGLQEAQGDLLRYTNTARTSARDLILLLLYAVAYPDVVIKANRKIRNNWQRRLGSLLYNLECRSLFDLSYWDINGTPKVFPRAFEHLLALQQSDDMIDAEFNVICRRQEYALLEVPIFSTRRHGGKTTTNYGSALRMYWGAYLLWRTMREGIK